jgi:hypothetical protein
MANPSKGGGAKLWVYGLQLSAYDRQAAESILQHRRNSEHQYLTSIFIPKCERMEQVYGISVNVLAFDRAWFNQALFCFFTE